MNLPIHEEVKRLLRLKSENVRNALSSTSEEAAITWLSELYKGNGKTVAFHTGARNHRSLLLSSPRMPDNILLIVKLIVSPHPLSYDRLKDELKDFEDYIGPKYECSQYSVIAPNGFEPKAERLEKYNMLLQDWSHLEDLISDYSKENKREPRIELFAHNSRTYKKVIKMMDHAKGIAVVQATGTGKSYLIARLLQDFAGEKRLVMAPSIYIIDQIKEHIRWETDLPGEASKIEFMTYARSMNLTPAEVAALRPKMIVLDEFHRCGAEEWGRGVLNILNDYPGAFKFGTSATPIRYLDNGRDMSHELFDGNVAENLSLAQAIARNILPMPKYVCALYTLSEEISSLRDRITGSRRNEATKRKMLLDLDTIHIDWERSRGIPHVLKKHLRKSMRKFIIFCKDEAHLNEMEPMVKKSFKEALDNIPVKSYRVHSKEAQSDEYLDAFKNDDSKDHLHLLFSIDMLNEGLHVNEVSGVILLRPTESPNIFYQQIGRCLKVGMNERPVIFDFVNNFKAIHTHDFLYDLDFARKELFAGRSEDGLEDRCPRFDVNDEVREISEVFGEIKFKLDNWIEMYERLVAYHKRFGHANVPYDWEEDIALGKWLPQQRKRYYYKKLEEDQLQKLDELGVEWSYQPAGALNDRWEEQYRELCEYRKKHGTCLIEAKTYPALARWVNDQRRNHRNGVLEKSRFNKLLKIGFVFEPTDEAWERQFMELDAFARKFGHCNVPFNNSPYRLLNKWTQHQRTYYRKGKLAKDKIERMQAIGFDFSPLDLDGDWLERFNELVAFKKKNGHLEVTPSDNKTLNIWIGRQRNRSKRGLVREDRIKKLDSIGFVWHMGSTKLFDKRFIAMHKFKMEFGHLNFPLKNPLNSWALHLRLHYKKGGLSKPQIQRLKDLGFDLTLKERHSDIREKRLQELEKFYKKYGHVDATGQYKDFPKLGAWMLSVRKQAKNGTLSKESIARLRAIDPEWESSHKDKKWNKMYDELFALYKKTGSAFIEKNDNKYKELKRWCNQQRTFRKEGRLTKERLAKLDKIGFAWDHKDAGWDLRFNELCEFKKRYGHCRVTGSMKEYSKLFNWCSNMRRDFREGKLSKERMRKLKGLGFE